MANFSKKTKQRIIDDYLQATGANMYVPSEFVSWLSGQPEHEAYSAFYGMDDIDAARSYRIDMARRLASGLRIVVRGEAVEASVISIRVAEYRLLRIAGMAVVMSRLIRLMLILRLSYAGRLELV